ncbi:MAG: PatA/PatG family cyanobactin maturation protease [Acidobacteriia bacterium]|nr:PatA/PatG family cyanobactin maturation protease [Terriglobia bacterium]
MVALGNAEEASVSLPSLLPDLELLWAESYGDPNIRIAILDGPVDLRHACFEGARLRVLETVTPGRPGGGGATQHGTHIASLIFGQHGSPVPGIAPGCTGLILPVFTDRPNGSVGPCSQLDLARAVEQAVMEGAQIVVVSSGQLAAGGEPEEYLAKAIRLCAESGVLVIAAAGNDGCDCLHVPAAVRPVLAVGGMDAAGRPLESNNWGAAYRSHGVVAPGFEIPGAMAGGGIVRKSGSSPATAIVAGIAAVLLAIRMKMGSLADPYTVRSAILSNALPCDLPEGTACRQLLAGGINIPGSLAAIRAESPFGLSALASATDWESESTRQGERPVPNDQMQAESGPPTASLDSAHLPVAADALSTGVNPSECSCKGGASEGPPNRSLVYALGVVGYDFGSEARRDSFVQQGVSNPANPAEMLAHLSANPYAATGVKWTLMQQSTPIYSVVPSGPFAGQGYETLRAFLDAQIRGEAEQVSVPGHIMGSTKLMNGQTVPVLIPELRGMYSWSTAALVAAVAGPVPEEDADKAAYQQKAGEIGNFLTRIYHELRNLGVTPQDRAVNSAATNALQVSRVYQAALQAGLKLDSIQVERSPLCRPNSDCWDVKMGFFNPSKRLEQARHVYRFTVDVSDTIPVTVGQIRDWDIY